MPCLNKEMVKYIEDNILPHYEKNDKGHGLSHIEYVTERCFKFAKQFSDINIDLLYAIASFHDIAHHIDKSRHEILSAEIFYKDEEMKRFFTEEERLIIKQAIEDHRASAESEPRSIYGKIISSADRSTDVEDFLRRTHAYTLKHFKGISESEIIERGYTHTKEKYGAKGYAKHYVEDEEYNAFRNKINEIINDRALFEKTYKGINGIR
ncbi:MAG: HD domain-containing protein [Clostridia bacterium]|nr:HD domain-containing protein [Clostridia bacterium]